MKKTLKLLIDIIAVIVLVAIDQLTKYWAVITLKDKEPIPIINGILEFHYLPNGNSGAAFGMLSGQKYLFLIIATIVIIAIFYLLYVMPQDKKYSVLRILLVLIIAGGAGNMIDRIAFTNVIDFIYIVIINFPIFNVADMYVSVSTVLLALMLVFRYSESDFAELEKTVKASFRKNKGEK